MDAVIATNTTSAARAWKAWSTPTKPAACPGHRSNPGRSRARRAAQRLPPLVALIGVGGITRGQDAADKLDLGASLVQFYTGMVYRVPELVAECLQAIADREGRMRVVEQAFAAGPEHTSAWRRRAALLLNIENEEDVLALPALRPTRDLVLGGGSNMVFATRRARHRLPQLHPRHRRGRRGRRPTTACWRSARAKTGTNWCVWTLVRQGYFGLENLSLIPGPGRGSADPEHRRLRRRAGLGAGSVTAWDWQRSAGPASAAKSAAWRTGTACSNRSRRTVT
jgi:hypothetical protein